MPKSARIILKTGREKSVRHRHPWLFSGAIGGVEGSPAPGDIVRVQAANGEFLAYGYYNPRSQITLRLLAWKEDEAIDAAWWARRIRESIARRSTLMASPQTNALRLVYSEADGLPGLIVDRYADYLVCQFLTAGIERVRSEIVGQLEELVKPAGILDLSDTDTRNVEGLAPCTWLIRGTAPDHAVIVRENGFRFAVDLGGGQKTGFYLDQRDNRRVVSELAQGRSVLDCFCYTGGFTVPILAASPRSVMCIDSSEAALGLLRTNVSMLEHDSPGLKMGETELACANVFEELRRLRDRGRQFGMIILDPPKLAASHSQVARAKRAYKDLNLLALKLLTPGGVLATFSCSGAISRADLQSVVSWAATDANRQVRILRLLSQGGDHPVLSSFPESEYLKGILCIAD